MEHVMSMSQQRGSRAVAKVCWQERQTCSQNNHMEFPAANVLVSCGQCEEECLLLTKAGRYISKEALSPTPSCYSRQQSRSTPRKFRPAGASRRIFSPPWTSSRSSNSSRDAERRMRGSKPGVHRMQKSTDDDQDQRKKGGLAR